MELIKEGYAKTSVYNMAKKLHRTAQIKVGGGEATGDEVQELRRRKEIVKLEKEIAEIEAAKESLPERVIKIEGELRDLRTNLVDIWAIDMCDVVLKSKECPEHGKTMGIVVRCQECNYTMGFCWQDNA
ncbi:hypothetical protein ACFLTP_10395 [Chloroflexota bacterium]